MRDDAETRYGGWGPFLDALNAAAPGGITSKAGLPGQDEPAFGGLSDTIGPNYQPASDPRSPKYLGVVAAAKKPAGMK
jgi:hypothetical protein